MAKTKRQQGDRRDPGPKRRRRAASPGSVPESAEAASAGAPAAAIRVRMYRQGLGDCFLVTLPAAGGGSFHMLIDCGVLLGTADAAEKMEAVVRDVIATTGGRLDLAVVTHQHWDHVSGFLQARDLFAEGGAEEADGKLRIDRLWLAWTEDPTNRLANHLRAQRKQREQALRATVQSLRAVSGDLAREEARRAGLPERPQKDEKRRRASAPATSQRLAATADRVSELLGFFGARGGGGTEEALAAVRGFAGRPPRYCHPKKDPIVLAEVPGVRIYVLGPPEDEKLIKRSDPSRKHSEVYEDPARALNLENAFLAAALGAAQDGMVDDPMRELSFPFDHPYQVPVEQAKQIRFFQRHYYGEDRDSEHLDQSWRWIESDWFDVAAQLALQLDGDTNNTSLALAIELVESGKVLLFPADAQVGNWLSWAGLSWTVEDRKVTAHDLLRRTVLYKVGHHGSHNATLRDQGLEKMESDELVALIPVDREMAGKKRWKMPFPPLFDRLAEKTRGRVLMADDQQKVKDRPVPPDVPDPLWQAFQKSVVGETGLYVEVAIG